MGEERFTFLRAIGHGGMGEVHLVEDRALQRTVAQKRILVRSSRSMMRFKREFRVIEGLLHPNLVRLYELGEEQGELYYTMEYVDGADLDAYCTGAEEPPFSSGSSPGPWTPPSAPALEETVDVLAPTLGDEGTLDATLEVAGAGVLVTPGAASAPLALSAASDVRWDRLAHVLPQILEALAFLHESGVVHRDLKPPNIMVRRDGVVKLLDFGVLGELARPRSIDGAGEVVGTVGFMAPEQLTGAPPTPASDLYALGVTLFELVAGQPVFEGSTKEVICSHLGTPPPRLAELCPDAPPALAQTCAELLRKDPSQRPTLRELARRLLPAFGARAPVFPPPRPPPTELVGRGDEQAALRQRLDRARKGGFGLAALTGATGTGKTSLARWLADEAERAGVTVLRGQGRPSERVAFNAVDGCVDGLATVLGRRRLKRAPAPLRQALELAASAFPVLALKPLKIQPRVGASRGAAFAALASLLADEAGRAEGLLLLVDDLQWADADTLALLGYLADAAPAGVLISATLRDDVGGSPAGSWLEGQGEAAQLRVEGLALEATKTIIARSAGRAGVKLGPDELREAAETCKGHPYLAELAGRSLARPEPRGLHGAVQASLDVLLDAADEERRALLALLVAADDWSPVAQLARWSGRAPGHVLDALAPLELEGLVRCAGASGPQRSVDLYHSAVREAALRALSTESLRRAHGQIADALVDTGIPGQSARLVRHLLEADREAAAAEPAQEAARQAEAQQAYGLAAQMYEVALRGAQGPQRRPLLRGRARALELGARYVEAADCWRQVGEHTDGEEQVDATLHEAHALLAAAQIERGHEQLERALRSVGEPLPGRGGVAGLLAGLGFLLGPRRPPRSWRETDVGAILSHAQRDVRIGQMVSYFDPLAGMRFLRRARRGFVNSGAAEQAAWCDYVFTYMALFAARQRGPVALAGRYLASADAFAARVAEPSVWLRSMPAYIRGVAAQRDGRWADGIAALDEAALYYDEAGVRGTFEQLMVRVHRTQIDMFAQDLPAFDRSLERLRADAQGAADSAMHCHLIFCEGFRLIYAGRFDEAARLGQDLAGRWPAARPTFQRFIIEICLAVPEIYTNSCHEARRRLAATLRRYRGFRPLKTMYGGLFAAVCAMVEANALRSGDPAASARRCHRLAASARGATPLYHALAWRALAYAADAGGQHDQALVHLAQAEQEARTFGQQIDVAVARYQRGRRLRGDAGAELIASARALLTETGAADGVLDEDVGLRG